MSGARDIRHPPEALALKVATRALVGAAGGGEGAAATVGTRQQRMSDCGNANTNDWLRLDEIAALESVTAHQCGAPHVTRALALRQGFVLVPRPDAPIDKDGLLASVAALTCELGDVARSIGEALADGECDKAEAEHALQQLAELDVASGALRAKLQRIVLHGRDGAAIAGAINGEAGA